MKSEVVHDFDESLAQSHAASDLPIWEEMYRQAFPIRRHTSDERENGQHQLAGIDRCILLRGGRLIRIDEKVRGRNKITGKVYDDIALEFVSNTKTGADGWVVKPLLAEYIAYAIAPLGKGWLLPVIPLQAAWSKFGDQWKQQFGTIQALNKGYLTLSCCVTETALFSALGKWHRVHFTPIEINF